MLLSSSKEANQMFKSIDKVVRASEDVNSIKTESLDEDDMSGDGVVTQT